MNSTKVLILAAGFGSRLMPYTKDRPKGAVALAGKPFIDRIIQSWKDRGVTDFGVVTGYKKEILEKLDAEFFWNEKYDRTNMVYSLMCASSYLKEEGGVISYADIVYDERVTTPFLETEGDIVVAIDLLWDRLWSIRGEDPLETAETCKWSENSGEMVEIGDKPSSLDQIDGQYIGLVKFSSKGFARFSEVYEELKKTEGYTFRGRDFENLYLTDFLQILIDRGVKVVPAFVKRGWVEIDTVEDLEKYENLVKNDQISEQVVLQ